MEQTLVNEVSTATEGIEQKENNMTNGNITIESTKNVRSYLSAAKKNVSDHKVAYGVGAATVVGLGAGAYFLLKSTNTKKTISKVVWTVSKNAPLGLTIVGGLGLITTAVLAYKAAPKVEAVLDSIEERRDSGERVSTFQAARELAAPLAAPAFVGGVSVGAIGLSYYIMNGRLDAVSKLAQQQAKQLMNKDENLVEEVEVENEEGKVERVKVRVKENNNDLLGRWMNDSEEYVSDDPSYMITLIDQAEQHINDKLFMNGYVTMNYVLDQLGFSRTPQGASLGWTAADTFTLTKKIFADEDGEQAVFLQWTPAHNVYDAIEYDGRYAE